MGEPLKMRIGNAWPKKRKLATCGPRSPAVEPNCCPDIVCNLNIKIRTRGQHMHQNSSLPFVIVASTSLARRCTGPRGAGFTPDGWACSCICFPLVRILVCEIHAPCPSTAGRGASGRRRGDCRVLRGCSGWLRGSTTPSLFVTWSMSGEAQCLPDRCPAAA